MQQPLIGHSFTKLTVVDSSNNYAMQQITDGKAGHGNVYLANEQTGGKGQFDKKWHTGTENMAMSVVLEPFFLNLSNQFLLHTFICVSLIDILNTKNKGFTIKWPNDIYFNDRKAAGILIENKIKGNKWEYAVVGIGLNVNELEVEKTFVKAISLIQITGRKFNIELLASEITTKLETYWNLFKLQPTSFLEEYNKNLYKKNSQIKLKKDDLIFETILQKVTEDGKLICGANSELEFVHGEVEWVG